VKTTTYPVQLRHYLEPLFTNLRSLSSEWQVFAPPSCYLALLDLHLLRPFLNQSIQDSVLTHLLTPEESKIFHNFTYAKRQLEWLGGRIAAKYALHRVRCATKNVSSRLLMHSILPDRHGRPQVIPRPAESPAACVSISHSSGYAAAIACIKGVCGVDIQQKTPVLHRVQKRFADKEEIDAFGAFPQSSLTRLGLLWSAKEAIKKCLLPEHPSFLGTVKLVSVCYLEQERIWTGRFSLIHPVRDHVMVRMGEMDQHLIACTWGENNA